MHELWFSLVVVISVSPLGIRETPGIGRRDIAREGCHA